VAASWAVDRRLGHLLRIAVSVCAFIMVAIVFQAPTVRAADPDSDGDGLSDATEGNVLYVQSAGVTGLPAGIPDSGFQPVYATTSVAAWETASLLSWGGVPTGVYARIDLTHSSRTELVIVVGSWTGSGWDDRVVYDPGGRAPNGIPASVTHSHTRTTMCRWIEDYYYCWSTTFTETHSVVPAQLGGQPTLTVGTTYTPSSPGVSSGSPSFSVAVDLVKPASALTSSEVAAGIKAPSFQPDDFRTRGTWRVIVMDFVPGYSGTLTGVALRWEGRSSAWSWDSDGDGLGDGTEALHYGSVPVALDSDVDGLRDNVEVASSPVTVSVDGSSYTAWVTTDPTRWDTDGDGLGDGQERTLQTHPVLADTDYDSLSDGAEVVTYGSNPTRRDTDGDTLSDNVEVVARTLALTVNGGAQYRSVTTLPYAADSDGDGLRDDGEWYGTSSTGVRTDPSDWDTDDDGLGDNEAWTVFAIRGLSQLESVLTAIENRWPLRYYEPLIRDYISLYTEYAVTASPVSRDTDADGLSDFVEYFLHSDPRSTDTDGDRLPDGVDDDPTIVELGKPLISIDWISPPEYLVGWSLKRHWIRYSVYDSAGIDRVSVFKDDNFNAPVHTQYLYGSSSGQYTDNFDVGLLDAFDGARWDIYAWDVNGNRAEISLQQPTIFNAIGNFITSASVWGLGPESGGKLSGGWYAFRDTVVDLATLFLNPGAIFDGGKAVGDAFRSQGLGALVALGQALYAFIDGTQRSANPYSESECATNFQCNFNTFRLNWYAGYIATTIGLSIVGAAAAKAVVQGIKTSQVLAKISGVIGDLADATKVAQYVNRLKGIGILNSKVLMGAVFTTAFAAAAYVWPEIFGEWFSRYMGAAFVVVSVYSLKGAGVGERGLKAIPEAIRLGVIDDSFGQKLRLGLIRDALDYDPLKPAAGPNRLIRVINAPGRSVYLPNGARILDTVVLLEGDSASGWQHIRARHILGTDTSGTGRLTRFPADLSEPEIRRVIGEAVANGQIDSRDVSRIVHNFGGKYGINEFYVILFPDGRIKTAYPVNGPTVIVVRP